MTIARNTPTLRVVRSHRLCLVVLAHASLLFVGCKTEQKTVADAAATSASSSSASSTGAAKKMGLEGDIVVAAAQADDAGKPSPPRGAVRGTLVLGYRTAEEQREFDAGNPSMRTIRNTIDRWRVVEPEPDVDFDKTARVHYRLDDAPGDGTAVAVLDVAHDFWPTTFGGGHGKMGASKPGGGEIALAANPSRDEGKDGKDSKEPCAGARYKLIEVQIPPLPASTKAVMNVTPSRPGGSTRRFCAYLPESYDAKPERRYPVIYLLPGLLSNEMAYLRGDGSAAKRADKISAELGGREVILVGVDTATPLGSTYLEDSPVTGPWDTFLTTRAIPEIEKTVRVLTKRTARALVGQSTGGFNSLSYGFRHSDMVSVIGASSPDAPDLEAWMIDPSTAKSGDKNGGMPRRVHEWIRKWTRLDAELGGAGQMTSYAADWAETGQPAPAGQPRKDGRAFAPAWPFDLDSGIVDDMVLSQWVSKTPHGMLRDPKIALRLKKDLSGRVLITVGKNDEFELFGPAEKFAKELDEAGVKTQLTPTDHGHGNGLDRIETGIRFALERLDPAK